MLMIQMGGHLYSLKQTALKGKQQTSIKQWSARPTTTSTTSTITACLYHTLTSWTVQTYMMEDLAHKVLGEIKGLMAQYHAM